MKTDDDFLREHYAESLKQQVDREIKSELAKNPPNGHKSKPYAFELWNKYWNAQIYHIFSLGKTENQKAYEGPSGPEFIRYIIEERRAEGLPELKLEDRNRDKVPYDLIPDNDPG